ncbi:Hsp33 family molecular chaperone HslO [Lactobacillus sp. DCY120]|uniref:Hsp33 family molecular chaperone HslO n=1 Tax=Bombilactobacillus apium TaxID=2675299 RepID=A0A850QWW4_9LACO|nr:Hsp33 family molecular chaperone HslO [Bombilactobacillus apium]NVY96304.1 Hsp33 family molecular chaperone HslO [Bombilactobacillus apium]
MNDYLIRCLVAKSQLRFLAVDAPLTVRQAQLCHQLPAKSGADLGASLLGTLLLQQVLTKDAAPVAVNLTSSGVTIVTDAEKPGQVRGYLKSENNSKLGVTLPGVLTVSRFDDLHQPFRGQIELSSPIIAPNYTQYLQQSEQITSQMVCVLTQDEAGTIIHAKGLLLQALPQTPTKVWQAAQIKLKNLTASISELSLEECLKQLTPDQPAIATTRLPVAWQCSCSKERFEAGLATLGLSDLQDLAAQKTAVETVCPFCRAHYDFTPTEIADLIAEK